jgi:cytochrome c-type biogenesis protein CcmE
MTTCTIWNFEWGQAESVLAKHDETYMPKEVADALKAKGVWKEGSRP